MYLSQRAGSGINPLGALNSPRSATGPRSVTGPQVVASLSGLPSGRAGTIVTLKHMREYVRAAIRSPHQTIRLRAIEILDAAGIPPRKYMRELGALHAWVRDRIHYVRDPVNVELVQTPEKTLEIGRGDCDDKSALLAALLEATGHKARFTAVAFNGKPFSHVLVESKVGERWIPAETIIPKPLGWFPSGVTDKYSLKV